MGQPCAFQVPVVLFGAAHDPETDLSAAGRLLCEQSVRAEEQILWTTASVC
jgi:hypothetical protein